MRLFTYAAGLRICAVVFFVIVSELGCTRLSDYDRAAQGPAIWKIENDGGKGQVYLLGSVHMLKEGVVWYTPKIKGALEQATDVTFEIHLDPAGMDEMAKFMQEEGYYPEQESLKTHIEPALFDETLDAAKRVGIAPKVLDRLKPWYAATVLSLIYVEAYGHDPRLGVEPFIKAIAEKRQLPLTGLESVGDQMRALAGNPPEVQETLLRDTVKELKDLNKSIDDLTDAWVTGDLDKLEKMLNEPMRKNKAAYDAVVVKRNLRWIPRIRALMNKPGTHLVVVGVMHLVGPDGLIEVMHAKGIRLARM